MRWRQDSRALIEGLSLAIQHQFEEWKLTAAESEVALLLLKGLSLKEIAALRATSERTVREQARSVYRKADLGGRSALSAWFLEDLLLPPAP
ncbi:MAG: helix-turn-helix transcriptional regulator [Lysobacterales bacterium]|nr:MAG: helix-turn-helix transcriptional regulator [Xanthomonadales bacterium]